jgi:hypothetical protein
LALIFVALAVAEFALAQFRLRVVNRDDLAELLQVFWKLQAP